MASSATSETIRMSDQSGTSNVKEDKNITDTNNTASDQSVDKPDQPWKRFLAEETAARKGEGDNNKEAPHNWKPDSKESVQKPWLDWIQQNYDPKELEKEKDCEEFFSGTTAAEGG